MDLVIAPAIVGFNTQSGAPKLALQPGQVIDALVLQLLDAVTVRLSVGDTVIDVQTKVPLEPGAMVRLAVKGNGPDIRLVILATTPPQVGAPKPALAAASRPAAEHAQRLVASPSAPTVTIVAAGAEDGEDVRAITRAAAGAPPPPDVAAPDGPLDPARAVAEAIRSSAPRQTGLASLYADAARALIAPSLPASMKQAVAQVFSPHMPLIESTADMSADEIRQGFMRSGVLLESRIVAAARGVTPIPAPMDDVKAALLTLRQVLEVWIAANPLPPGEAKAGTHSLQALMPEQEPAQSPPSSETPPREGTPSPARDAPAALGKALPPPYRGAATVAQPPAAPSIAPDMPPHDIVRTLLAETDGALARQTLLQIASLPDAASAPAAQSDPATPRWHFELPFATRQGMAIAQFEIAPDSRHVTTESQSPTWRARFSVDVESLGPVHAQIAVTGARTAVRLWAERPETSAALRDGAGMLADALRHAELDPGDFLVRAGSPPRIGEAAPAGRFLDRAS